MQLTLESVLNYHPDQVVPLATALKDLDNITKREILLTYISGRLKNSDQQLNKSGERRNVGKSGRIDFILEVLEELEKELTPEESDVHSLKSSLGSGDIEMSKFGKLCFISTKEVFSRQSDIDEVFQNLGTGNIPSFQSYIFKHEREQLRSASQDIFIRSIDSATSGARLEFIEMNPDTYRVFYSVTNQQGMPCFVFDKNEKRFFNYSWGQPNASLRPLHEDFKGVDHSKRLVTKMGDDGHLLVQTEYGVPKTEENNYSNKKRVWKDFRTTWTNQTCLVRETDNIQGIIPVNVRGIKEKMTVPKLTSSLVVGNPDAIILDDEGVYDDVAYNRMVNFNPHKILVQIATNDKKGLSLRDSDDVPLSLRFKAAEALYNKAPRSKPVQKVAKKEGGDTSHVIISLPEKEGYADPDKKRLSGDDQKKAVMTWFDNDFAKEEAEYAEVI